MSMITKGAILKGATVKNFDEAPCRVGDKALIFGKSSMFDEVAILFLAHT